MAIAAAPPPRAAALLCAARGLLDAGRVHAPLPAAAPPPPAAVHPPLAVVLALLPVAASRSNICAVGPLNTSLKFLLSQVFT
jgi:hypothetical protein